MKFVAKSSIKAYNNSMRNKVEVIKMSGKKQELHPLLRMRNILQEEMKKSTKTEKEIRKSLGVKRYEK